MLQPLYMYFYTILIIHIHVLVYILYSGHVDLPSNYTITS